MAKTPFDTANPDFPLVRQIVLHRLRQDRDWHHLDYSGDGWLRYVDLVPPRPSGRDAFSFMALDVFWELVVEGLVAPGLNASNPNLPVFHLTRYGQEALAQNDYGPHDPTGYISQLRSRVSNLDPTVEAYLEESLNTFVRGRIVSAMVMLGIAAERVFNLLSNSLASSLLDPAEQKKLSALLERFPMKPKVDWVHDKLRRVQEGKPRPPGFPENATVMVIAIYDLIRTQRNDLGHPREVPPRLPNGEAHANLLIFPRYYETAEEVRRFLATNQV